MESRGISTVSRMQTRPRQQDQSSGDVSKDEELEIIKDTEDGPPYIRKLQVKE